MTALLTKPNISRSFTTDNQRWQAVARRDASGDGSFFYAVKTTGVYCRPSCAARLARRENVEFYASPDEAERAGFRACMRCKPRELSADGRRAAAVAKACEAIARAKGPVSLEALADAAGMTQWHFLRVFKSFTGLTPKGYSAAHRSRRMRDELSHGQPVTSAIFNAGFGSGAGFYANSAKVLGMKPAEFKSGGKGVTIRFAVGECSLGSILVAASELGICAISLGDDPNVLVEELQDRFSGAELVGGDRNFERLIGRVVAFVERPAMGLALPLHVQGTAFQQRVWKKLSEIPCGKTRSYSEIAAELGKPKATRAVARACAVNTIAVAIPCHRAVRRNGDASGYRWGVERKVKLLKVESQI